MSEERRRYLLVLQVELYSWLILIAETLQYARCALSFAVGLAVGWSHYALGARILLAGAGAYLFLLLLRFGLYRFLYWASCELEKNHNNDPGHSG